MGLDFNSVTRLNVSSLAASLIGAAGDAHDKRNERPTLYVASDGRKAMVPKYMTKKAEPQALDMWVARLHSGKRVDAWMCKQANVTHVPDGA
jgi:hypothetical protein